MSSYEDFLVRAKQEKRKDDLQDVLNDTLTTTQDLRNQNEAIIGVLDDLFKIFKDINELERAKIKKGETYLSSFTIPSIGSGSARLIYFDFLKGDKAGGSLNVKELSTQEIDYPYSRCFNVEIRNIGPATIDFRLNPKGQRDNRLSGQLQAGETRTFNSDWPIYHGVNIAIDKNDTVNSADVEVFCET